ncbi:MAG: hypothetical protein ACRYHA_26870 [Janthinobacterium lividum]
MNIARNSKNEIRGVEMFEFEPGYWLIVLAVGVFFLTAVVILASSLMGEDDPAFASPLAGHPGKDSEAA